MISILDIYKIGIGPSSSHTFGTMVSANMFLDYLKQIHQFNNIHHFEYHLYGSLALTGYGHGTCLSIELGLEGWTPAKIDPKKVDFEKDRIQKEKILNLVCDDGTIKPICYDKQKHRFLHYNETLPFHSNGMKFLAFDKDNTLLGEQTYYSIGGGFVMTDDDVKNNKRISQEKITKYDFKSFDELKEICKKENKTIDNIVFENELELHNKQEIEEHLKKVVFTMNEMIENGLSRTGNLKGIIDLPRRSNILLQKIAEQEKKNKGKITDFFEIMDYVSMWALAGAEENASFGRVITAPTNGACAVIPAVLKFVEKFYPDTYTFENIKKFIFTSGAVGILCKKNATISGAEGGCQVEIGTACAMASAGLTAMFGGTIEQIENSAVIALVHNFGLTCDPVAGLVQVPCIERNAVNAIKAIHASRLALMEEKSFFVSLDQAILTMKQVGKDMNCKYKETSLGGLAINCQYCKDKLDCCE